METSDDSQPWEHLSEEGNELRRRALESNDLRIWDLAFMAGRISVAEGAPRYFMTGKTKGINLGVMPAKLIANQNNPKNT